MEHPVFSAFFNLLESESFSVSVEKIEINGRQGFLFPFMGDNGVWMCVAFPIGDTFSLCSIYPGNIPEAKYATVIDLSNRINLMAMWGYYEFHYDIPQLRFRTPILSYPDSSLDEELKKILINHLLSFDIILPIIFNVLEMDLTPEAAFEEAKAQADLAKFQLNT